MGARPGPDRGVLGAALTVGYSMVAGDEAISPVRVVLIVALVGCVVGLKLTH